MCTVSNRLTLCACPTDNVEDLAHYWVLQRPTGDNITVYGEAILPANIGAAAHELNSNTLAAMLNQGNCFDISLQHQENDILTIHLSFQPDVGKVLPLPCHGNYLAYAFLFKNNQWQQTDYDPFGQNLAAIQQGKIQDPF